MNPKNRVQKKNSTVSPTGQASVSPCPASKNAAPRSYIMLEIPPKLSKGLKAESQRLEISNEFFILEAIRLRLEILALGENPKTIGLRAINRIVQLMGPSSISRLLGIQSLEEVIVGSDRIQELIDLAEKRGIRPLELLALAFRFKLKEAGIDPKAEWIIPMAQEVVECMSETAVQGGVR